jgi:hypothetical protein
MKTIVAGSRHCFESAILERALLRTSWEISEVVCGGARGADNLGRTWAINHGIPVKMFPADWEGLGKGAGFIRNQEMADYAQALILLWDGRSRGSWDMLIKIARQNKPFIAEFF